MRKIKNLLMLVSIFCLVSCMKSAVPSFQFTIGVIETTEHKELSKITFYDENLNKVKEKKVKYAGLGTHWLDPIYKNNSVFFTTDGLVGYGLGNDVVEISLKNGEDIGYKFDHMNIQSIDIKEDKIIAVSNLNAVSYLTIYDKKNKIKLREVSYNTLLAHLVVCVNNKIYSFCNESDYAGVTMLVHDMELHELSRKRIKGESHYKYHVIGDKLYFSYQSSEKENGVGILDVISNEVEKVELTEKFPHTIVQLNDRELLISHTDTIIPRGTKIGIYNMLTKEEIIYDIGNEIITYTYVNDILYVLTRTKKIISYKLQENSLEKLNEVTCEVGELHEITYISTIFGNIKK